LQSNFDINLQRLFLKEWRGRHQESNNIVDINLFLASFPGYVSVVAKLRHHVEARTLYDPTQDESGSQAWEYSKHTPPQKKQTWYVCVL
jgi:hypothetical protein